jgi:hypothetical protein
MQELENITVQHTAKEWEDIARPFRNSPDHNTKKLARMITDTTFPYSLDTIVQFVLDPLTASLVKMMEEGAKE